MNALYKHDTQSAYTIARSKTEALENCEKFIIKNKTNHTVVGITDKIKQMMSDTHDITRSIYLFSLEESQKE